MIELSIAVICFGLFLTTFFYRTSKTALNVVLMLIIAVMFCLLGGTFTLNVYLLIYPVPDFPYKANEAFVFASILGMVGLLLLSWRTFKIRDECFEES